MVPKEHLLQQKLLILSTAMMAAAAIFWGGIYYYYDEKTAALVPWAYVIVSFLSLLILRGSKSIRIFRASQLFMSLFFPFVLMWLLGGFVNSSAVVIWSLICPMGALVFSERKTALALFLVFILLIVGSIVVDFPSIRHSNNLPDWMIAGFFVMNLAGVSIVAFVLLRYFVGEKEKILDLLDRERERSETLVRNMLPESISERLKEEQKPIADSLEGMTILFADIAGFTRFAMDHPPEKVVSLLDRIFSHFDQFSADLGLEKIKTIGDAYMLCGGLDGDKQAGARGCAAFALQVIDYMNKLGKESDDNLDIRIGINTGSVVAGVIGTSKYSYDIWGDSVNVAARLQQIADVGTIFISKQTQQVLDETFKTKPMGDVELKGHSAVQIFQLIGKS